MERIMGPSLEQSSVPLLSDSPKDVWILLEKSVRYHYIERNLRGQKKVTTREVAAILNSSYGRDITVNSLNNHLSNWGCRRKEFGSSYAAGASPLQSQTSVAQRELQRKPSQNSIPGTITTPIEKRRDLVIKYVQAVINSEFGKQTLKYPDAGQFDLMWLKPGYDYSTSWQMLSKKSSSLPGLAQTDRLDKFRTTLDEIFNGVEPAMLGDKEVNIMVSIWRICGDFQNASVSSHNQSLVHGLFSYIWRVRKSRSSSTDPLMQLCEVILQSGLDELRPLLGFGYERAIHCLNNYFKPNNFTIPQMTTNFLMFWNDEQTLFPDLTGDFEALIAYADEHRDPLNWCSLTCLNQFLYYAVYIEQNKQRSMLIAMNLNTRAQKILSNLLSNRAIIKWDSVARDYTFSAKVLIYWYQGRKMANDAFKYFKAVWDMLSNGDGDCVRQAKIFGCEFYDLLRLL